MRIERVVAASFAEASELSKVRFGNDVLLLSSERVGNSHELLLGVESDDIVDNEAALVKPEAKNFSTVLKGEFEASDARPIGTATGSIGKRLPDGHERHVSGEYLVASIREELKALECRLSANSGEHQLRQRMFSLLEAGISASFASELVRENAETNCIAERFVDSLSLADWDSAETSPRIAIFGPPSSGRTTLCMQVANTVQSEVGLPTVVCAEGDGRVGARERFFSIADSSKTKSVWGHVPGEGPLVIDVGGGAVHRSPDSEFHGCKRVLCIPSYLSRAAALHAIGEKSAWDCVIFTFWSDQQLPLGLIGLMAELSIPIAGVSSSAEANCLVRKSSAVDYTGLIKTALSLVLSSSLQAARS